MKGIDTPVLLELLRGSPAARAWVRGAGGEELATTEINFFELETLARLDRSPGRERRLAALDKLRRRLTVVPIDARASAAARAREAPPRGAPWISLLVLGALEAAGCSEIVTSEALARLRSGKARTRRSGRHGPKKRE
jgi:hypothetical protein